MTVSERIPFSGLLLPLPKGYTYSCDRRTTDGMELLFISREDGRSRYYFESDMQEFDRKAASDTYSRTDGNLRHSFKSAQQVKNLLGALSLCLRQKSAVFSSKTNAQRYSQGSRNRYRLRCRALSKRLTASRWIAMNC